ncbi:MAG: hypothetical protein AUH33_02780 [Chloroflexi bacterium 13_1_40CM_68_21]|nr:MAG: hypothetical protein AUH33_02780 [Chloroflexi bacterium 13_1_40CM_68_21]
MIMALEGGNQLRVAAFQKIVDDIGSDPLKRLSLAASRTTSLANLLDRVAMAKLGQCPHGGNSIEELRALQLSQEQWDERPSRDRVAFKKPFDCPVAHVRVAILRRLQKERRGGGTKDRGGGIDRPLANLDLRVSDEIAEDRQCARPVDGELGKQIPVLLLASVFRDPSCPGHVGTVAHLAGASP